jgi:hypothetical protein
VGEDPNRQEAAVALANKIGSEAGTEDSVLDAICGTRLQVLVDARNILNSCRNRGKAGSSSRIR